jgi:hypothetical protein
MPQPLMPPPITKMSLVVWFMGLPAFASPSGVPQDREPVNQAARISFGMFVYARLLAHLARNRGNPSSFLDDVCSLCSLQRQNDGVRLGQLSPAADHCPRPQ